MPSTKTANDTPLKRDPALPLDNRLKPTQIPHAVKAIFSLYGDAANKCFADDDRETLDALLGEVLLMTVGIMRAYLGDETTIHELGRAVRRLQDTEWDVPAGTTICVGAANDES